MTYIRKRERGCICVIVCYCSLRYLIFNEDRGKGKEKAIWALTGRFLCAFLNFVCEMLKNRMFGCSRSLICVHKCMFVYSYNYASSVAMEASVAKYSSLL